MTKKINFLKVLKLFNKGMKGCLHIVLCMVLHNDSSLKIHLSSLLILLLRALLTPG
jgi:hypothetical protein